MSEETKTEESTPETLGDYLRVKREKGTFFEGYIFKN